MREFSHPQKKFFSLAVVSILNPKESLRAGHQRLLLLITQPFILLNFIKLFLCVLFKLFEFCDDVYDCSFEFWVPVGFGG